MQAFTFQSADRLSLRGYKSEISDPKANVIFVHGFFEHAGRYSREAEMCNSRGFNFYAYDHRTHGHSEGQPRAYINTVSDYLDDLSLFLDELKLNEDVSNFILSHSFGGLTICNYLIQGKKFPGQTNGLIFSAPFLKPDENTAPILQKLAGVVGTLLPKLKVVEIDSNNISNDPVEIKNYEIDPLIYHGKMYAGSAWQMLKQIKSMNNKYSKISLPLLILHGTADKVANPKGAQVLFDNCSSSEKKLHWLESQKHEILKDTDKETTWKTIFDWIENRVI